jgi:hypothetical protein
MTGQRSLTDRSWPALGRLTRVQAVRYNPIWGRISGAPSG